MVGKNRGAACLMRSVGWRYSVCQPQWIYTEFCPFERYLYDYCGIFNGTASYLLAVNDLLTC